MMCIQMVHVSASDDVVDDIWKYEFDTANVPDGESFLELGLMPSVGNGSEWLAICLHRCDKSLSYDAYVDALSDRIKESGHKSTDYMRMGLCLAELSGDEALIANVIRNNTDYDNIMAVIYGLMLCKEAEYDPEYAAEQFGDRLTSRVNPDGGWSLMPGVSDPDVTAMAVRALSYLKDYCEATIDGALQYLSAVQKDNGGYESYGIENSESCSQVIMALLSLDIDIDTDERFVKNKRTLWEVLMSYRCEDGGFAHIEGGQSDKMATLQALQAFLAAKDAYDDTPAAEPESSETELIPDETGAGTGGLFGACIKLLLIAAVLVIALIIAVSLCVCKKMTLHKGIVLAAVTAVCVAVLCLVRIESVSEYNDRMNREGELTTYITIIGHDGTILERTAISVNTGDSAFDQLQKAAAVADIPVGYTGSGLMGTIYVNSIAGLSESEYGPLSGWKYSVGGEFPMKSCSEYVLKALDEVVWVYTDE